MKKKVYAVRKGRTTGLFADWEACRASVEGFSGAEYKSFADEESALQYLRGESPVPNNDPPALKDDSPIPKNSSPALKDDKKAQKDKPSVSQAQKKKHLPPLEKGFYFDGGTGLSAELGLEVVETNLTDETGRPLLSRAFFDSIPTAFRFGSYHEREGYRTVLFFKEDGFTNNFAELYGLYLALKAALTGSCPELSPDPEDAAAAPPSEGSSAKNPSGGLPAIFGDSELILRWWSKGHVRLDDEKTQQLAREVMLQREEYEAMGGHIEKISGDINPADLGFHR